MAETLIGQKEYAISGDLLGIKAVRINGRKVNAKFWIDLPRVPSKNADLMVEIERAVITKKPIAKAELLKFFSSVCQNPYLAEGTKLEMIIKKFDLDVK